MESDSTAISSLTNPRIKQAVKLRQRSHRDELKLMLIEGYREIRRAVDNKHFPIQLFFCAEMFQGRNEDSLMKDCRMAGAELFSCTPAVFQKLSYRDRPEGLLAVAGRIRTGLADVKLAARALLIVAESVEKPGNLGTIIRSADAAGADAVIVCDHCTDVNNPNVVRASLGTVFTVPVVETSADEAIEWLSQNSVQTVAATPHADTLYTSADLTRSIAIVVGTEQYGLSGKWLDRADLQVRIPMLGQSDSLNVASATTILLYEAVRQRASSSS